MGLTKNKDPLNGSVVGLLKKSTMDVLRDIWFTYVSADDAADAAKKSAGGKGKKKGGGGAMTISGQHKESLGRLMNNLKSTQPHFVRCIIPNEIKKPGYMDWNLVLHQLRCNGVLEGIRICRKGFPSRVQFEEFVLRYIVLFPSEKTSMEDIIDYKKTAKIITDGIQLEDWKFRFGHTKMFFKAGIIGDLEDMRDEKIAAILTSLQSYMRYRLAAINFNEMIKRRDSIDVIQSNLRAFMYLKDWEWMKIIFKIKPLISQAEEGKKLQELEKNYKEVKEKLEKKKS